MQKNEIKNIYFEMYSCMINKDISGLEKLLDDSFVLVHMTGMRQSKHEYLNAIKDGTLNYFSEETEHIEVAINGDTASLTGQSRVNASVFGGGRHTWQLELDIDLIHKHGQWLMTEARASTY
ncbi:MAG: nuclear transport factor 2 family protein [Synergistaceae bacterium]|nr:nuclear transport factor 2 family protein [Synergistaceae bacterium]MBR0203833.1 nuclear transport factor 2 family protein [Synergistaceae bacterium]